MIEAEALLRRTPRFAKLYQFLDTRNLGEAIRSGDPLSDRKLVGELLRKVENA
jgi:hypothetical protein